MVSPFALQGVSLAPERPSDDPAIERLMNLAFGASREELSVYKLRAGPPVAPLGFIALDQQGAMRGSLRFWRVEIENNPFKAVLLGPLALEPRIRGGGLGKALVERGLEEASQRGYQLCLVMGAPEIYTKFGFTNVVAMGLSINGPFDPRRFQVKELQPGVLSHGVKKGLVLPWRP